ncbi:MAG: AI-2E family transporter [Spirochaetes bacterium]|nr:AI-2E family transporter [Spirochaetota bacterium]
MEESKNFRIMTIAASIIVLVAVVFILKTLKGIFIPLVLSIFITYLFAPAVEFLARLKVPRIVSLFILLIIVCLIGFFFAQIVINNIRNFIEYWPSMEKAMFKKAGALLNRYMEVDLTSIRDFLGSARIQEFMRGIFSGSFAVVGKVGLTLLLLIFISLSYHNYPRLIRKAFDKERAARIYRVLDNINDQIVRYLFYKTVISAGTGILTGVSCAILGIKFSVLWGVLAFFLNYIPYIGSIIAVIPPIILSFLQFPHSYVPYLTAILLIGIQLVIGSFLDPEIMGNRFNLSPIVILVALFFWGYVWGGVGTFLAVPIMAIVKIVFHNIDSTRFIAVLMSKRAE